MSRIDVDSNALLRWTHGFSTILPTNGFQRRRLESVGISPSDLRDPELFRHLPFTTKTELARDQLEFPPYGSNLSYPIGQYVRLHQTSGTTGQRLNWLDSAADWRWLMDCWDQIYEAAKITPVDRVFVPFSFGPFLGFWAGFEAALRRGCFVLAGGGLSTGARLKLVRDHQISLILCTPTYALRMAEAAIEEGSSLEQTGVRALILAGEPGASIATTRASIEAAWGARVFDHYGMTEAGSLAAELVERPGQLVLLDSFCLSEVINPKDATPTEDGQIGELVLTNIGRWGSPLVRYRTGDLVRRRRVPWEGQLRTFLEGGVTGRVDDMLWVKGNNVFPSAVEDVLRGFPRIAEFQLEIDDRRGAAAELTIRVELAGDSSTTDPVKEIQQAISDRLYFQPRVEVVAKGSLPRFEMKSRRVLRTPSASLPSVS